MRPWCVNDAHALPTALGDSLIPRWTRIRADYTWRDAQAWVATDHGPNALELAIVGKTDDDLLGGLRIDCDDGKLCAGYWIRASARGDGIASEALEAAARRTARVAPHAALEVLIRVSNERSQRAAHRAGFEHVECLRRHRLVGGHPEDYVRLRFGRAESKAS
jgi:RimJ/RimL family protein N-acetyltransferase